MSSPNKTPSLRFTGFTDPWEQRKLKDTFDSLQNNTLSRAELSLESGAAKNVHYGDVLIKFGEYLDATKMELPYIPSQQIADKYKSSTLQDGDIILADTAEDETVGKCTEIANLQGFPTISGLHTIPLRPKDKFAAGFLGYYMNSEAYHDQLLPLMQGIKVTSISKGVLQDTDISYPSDTAEQAAIGRYFINLDTLITLHQRKYEKLLLIKKSMLEKMFPREGYNVPEIRFSGFTVPWEQRKLKGLANVKDSARISNAFWTDKGVPYIRASDLSNNDLSGVLFLSEETFDNYKKQTGAPARGDLLFNGGGEIGKAVLKRDDKPLYVQGGAVLYIQTSLSTAIDGEYLEAYFQCPSAKKYIDVASAGGTMKHFTLGPSQEMPVAYPSLAEQLKIGTFLSNLDKTITLHQRKLEKLKTLKKSMLEKMFV